VKFLKFFLKFLLTVALGGAALAGSLTLLGPASQPLTHATTPIGKLELTINAPPARSLIYDRNGSLVSTLATEDRSPVRLRDIPQVLINAVISIEDRKFYEHHGVDWSGTTRALFKNVDAGGISQGGSTITQQLVKNTFSVGRKRDLTTKAREAVLAINLEKQLSKNQILVDYLNLVYFGNGAYGVQAAAERYFPLTPLQKLDLPQAALLAGLIQSPEALNPAKHPGAAARRRSEVLDAMVANGKTTAAAAKLSKSVPLPTTLSYPHSASLDYYMDEVKNVLLTDDPTVQGDPAESLGSTQQVRSTALYRGGLKIYTAYDPTLQFEATAAMNAELPPNTQFTASLVVIDNADGGVRAIANGRTFEQMQFDPATEGPGRQAGSSFKTFTLAAALSRGYSANDTVSTSPLHWRLDQGSGQNSFYNLGGGGDDCGNDTISLTRAISRSDNCAFVRTELSLGPGHFGADGVGAVIQMAKAMGINTSNFNPGVVSTTLGTQGVHPLDMAQAYSVLPNEGILKRATFITKIVDRNGRTIYQAPTSGTRVLDQNVARTETKMLTGVLRSGTAASSLGRFPRPAAGKTGTTDHNQDAWFVGYTPQFTAAVWMGNPLGEVPMTNVNGIRVFGATFPALIWRHFMEDATNPLPVVPFGEPDDTLYSHSRFITELGRKTTYQAPSSDFTTTTLPVLPPPTTPTPSTKAGPKPTVPHTTPHTRKPTPTTAPGKKSGKGP
jgi:membrane peptidoglycan carboxypeptidase